MPAMFEPSDTPRLFALPPGADFPRALVAGLHARMAGQPPEALARVELYVNTRRMQRRIRELFAQEGALLLPRIRLVTDLARDGAMADIPPAVPPLRRRLELSQLVAHLLDAQPDLAPRAALYDLADSLAGLMDEMQGEGVPPEALERLDLTDHSRHWERSLAFIRIVARYFDPAQTEAPDPEARQRQVVARLEQLWAQTPPPHPVIVAGSTGSRGTTARLMQAVARLPQGAIVLPGYDFDMPQAIWESLDDVLTAEDHPQFRFRKLMRMLDIAPAAIQRWSAQDAPHPARNRLISLALRPAPVTDQWMSEGRSLTGIPEATAQMALIEAPSQRAEALAIALRLRKAAEDGITAALITPDRGLTRQVTAALDRWRIIPDDSAGQPLALSAPGRFLRHVAALFGRKLTSGALLTLLKHPISHSGAGRGDHLRWTRELELSLRRNGPLFPTAESLHGWAGHHKEKDGRQAWAEWLGGLLTGLEDIATRPLADHLAHHLGLAQALAAGPGGTESGALWLEDAGRSALAAVEELEREAHHGGALIPEDYSDLFTAILHRHEVRHSTQPHPRIMIWGTLEARVQGADLVILGGLNDGIWPQIPAPDPWLNRKMRHDAGLLLPERRIGLSAHDFQQAIAAKEVVLTRAIRDAEAQTVASRWLNRLVNLLGGLQGQGGSAALDAMRQRGQDWLARASALEAGYTAVPPAKRPAPRPPITARPRELAVTGIRTLIRDPYAIYARHILKLQPLDPLHPAPDAALRGSVLHSILERFIRERQSEPHPAARARLLAITDAVLEQDIPWPAARRLWRARLERVADWFLEREAARDGTPVLIEEKGGVTLGTHDFRLTARPDRIDLEADGRLHILDYKTGTPPTPKQQEHFEKQLLLEAAMAERGGFGEVGVAEVAAVTYIGLGATPREERTDITPGITAQTWAGLEKLIARYMRREQGYPARRAVFETHIQGPYDHLARFGEWEMSDSPAPEDVG